LFVCRLNAKRPRGFPAGAIPTVDFLLARPAAIVKKMAVKTHDGAGSKFPTDWIACPVGLLQFSFYASVPQKSKAPARLPGRRNSNCGFSPTPRERGRQKKACQIL
jgi:hypothetical protein